MELRHYLRSVVGSMALIVLAVVVAAAAAFVLSNTAPKTYTADAQLVVNAGLGVDGTGTDNVLTAPRIGQTYAVLASTRPVLLQVIQRADLPYEPAELMRRLSVVANLDTPFLVISMNDSDPERAARTANALADVLVERGTIPASGGTSRQEILAVVERAVPPDDPTGPRVLFNTLLAAAAALIIGLVIVAFISYFRQDPARSSDRSGG